MILSWWLKGRDCQTEFQNSTTKTMIGITLLDWVDLASQPVQVGRIKRKAEELEIKEELILVIDEMLEVSQQQSEDRLAFAHEECWKHP